MCNKYIIWKERKVNYRVAFSRFICYIKVKYYEKIFWFLEKESQRNVFLRTTEMMIIKHAHIKLIIKKIIAKIWKYSKRNIFPLQN